MIKTIKVSLKDTPYKVYLGKGVARKIPFYLRNLDLGNFCVIITNQRIHSLYKTLIKKIIKGYPHIIFKLPDSERAKSKKYMFNIIQELLKQDKLKRKLFIICLGGGVIGDVGGFVASIYKRGIPYIQIPTTFLAQIDASIGGKTAIDFGEVKNIIGTFYQPRAVFIDPLFLKTLSSRAIKQGISEAIKYGTIKNRQLFFFLKKSHSKITALDLDYLQKVIYECVKIKAKIVEEDEKENKGQRTILNFGHTTAHAIEAILKFKKLSHGEAVALGMINAAYISYYLGLCPETELSLLTDLIRMYSLPTKLSFNTKRLLERLMFDKKFIHGKIRMVLLTKIGKTKIHEDVTIALIKKSLQHISTYTLSKLTKY